MYSMSMDIHPAVTASMLAVGSGYSLAISLR